MFNEFEKMRLTMSLAKKMEDWWEELNTSDDSPKLPIVGEEFFFIAATAAVAVLDGIADTQQYYVDSNMLKD